MSKHLDIGSFDAMIKNLSVELKTMTSTIKPIFKSPVDNVNQYDTSPLEETDTSPLEDTDAIPLEETDSSLTQDTDAIPLEETDSSLAQDASTLWKDVKHNNKKCRKRIVTNTSKHTSDEEFMSFMKKCGITPEIMQDQNAWSYDYIHFHHNTEKDKEKPGLCPCGKRIKHVIYVLYQPMDLYFQIGHDCLEKNLYWIHQLIELDKQREHLNRLTRTKTKQTKPSELYRMCLACHQKNIHFSEPQKKIRCKTCFANFVPVDKKYFRSCNTCERFVILKTEPEFRVQCLNCFTDNKTPYCVHCQGTGLALWSAELYRTCSECFS